MKQAVITLIDKGSDCTLLKYWCPISLQNTDYKIASKVIAERLKHSLPVIISPNQIGYVKDRNITDNVRIISDIINYTDINDIHGILLTIDFQKAFDCVNWEFLELTLKKFKYGPSFIRWIKTFYNNISSCIINHRYTSKYFPVRQGCQVTHCHLIYSYLWQKSWGSKIRANVDIRGIEMYGTQHKILQYADDTNGIVRDLRSAKLFLETVHTFGKYSNLKLNKEKT